MKPLLLVLPILVGACSAQVATAPVRDERAEARLATLLGGKVQGATRSCIARRDAERQEIIDENTIVYRTGDRVIRGDIAPACGGLDRNSTLIRRSTSSDICSGEIFEIRDSGTQLPRGSCTYGEFTEYRSPPG